jgi:hypothetical protein
MAEPFAMTWKDIALGFLKVGATAYGGPAIMGIMQAEFQERHAGADRHHGRVHRLPGRGVSRCGRGGGRRLSPRLPVRRHPVSLLRPHQWQSESEGLRGWSHRGRLRHDRRRMLRPREAGGRRRAHARHRRVRPGGGVALQGTGALLIAAGAAVGLVIFSLR